MNRLALNGAKRVYPPYFVRSLEIPPVWVFFILLFLIIELLEPSNTSAAPLTSHFLISSSEHPCPRHFTPIELAIHLSPRGQNVRSPLGPKGQVLDDDAVWLTAQITEANALFRPVEVCFIPVEGTRLPKELGEVLTRKQRLLLGHEGRTKRGRIDLFIVNRLGDIDQAGEEIRGVHWRDPKDPSKRRWIILSRIARHKVLAHELGHYFSLPHSDFPESIMNKSTRSRPPLSERHFAKTEYLQMKRARITMIRRGQLKPYRGHIVK